MKAFKTEIELVIEPRMFNDRCPFVNVHINDETLYSNYLSNTTKIILNKELPVNNYNIVVSFNNKTKFDSNLENNLDLAIIINSLTINKIDCTDLFYLSEYYSKEGGLRKSVTYLGWNGVWTLKFSVPAFEWIHNVKHFGWIFR